MECPRIVSTDLGLPAYRKFSGDYACSLYLEFPAVVQPYVPAKSAMLSPMGLVAESWRGC
jgi:hypothetical protein